jgi:hypothetical protein
MEGNIRCQEWWMDGKGDKDEMDEQTKEKNKSGVAESSRVKQAENKNDGRPRINQEMQAAEPMRMDGWRRREERCGIRRKR